MGPDARRLRQLRAYLRRIDARLQADYQKPPDNEPRLTPEDTPSE